MFRLEKIDNDVKRCTKCARLIPYCKEIARVKKRSHQLETYWGKPVPGFGDPKARLWIIGLAPAAHGANRTGRMFTGDSSGDWLYRALYNVGLANQPTSQRRGDGLILNDVFISAAARCAPPDNKPSLEELKNCSPFLQREFEALNNLEIILALGKIAFDSVFTFLPAPKPRPKFVHAGVFHVENLSLFTSYHPSRQNTNTGRLTQEMWDLVFRKIKTTLS